MVVETIYRLGTVARKAVAYFSPNLFEIADYTHLSSKRIDQRDTPTLSHSSTPAATIIILKQKCDKGPHPHNHHQQQAITTVHSFAASHGHRISPLDSANPPPPSDAPPTVSTHDATAMPADAFEVEVGTPSELVGRGTPHQLRRRDRSRSQPRRHEPHPRADHRRDIGKPQPRADRHDAAIPRQRATHR